MAIFATDSSIGFGLELGILRVERVIPQKTCCCQDPNGWRICVATLLRVVAVRATSRSFEV